MLRKTQIAAAVGAALFVAGTAAYAQAPNVQVYGQVSRTMMYADDGQTSKWFNVDNEASGTRVGITGGAPVMGGLKAGFRLEWDFQSNESQRAVLGPGNAASDNPAHTSGSGFSERHADMWLESSWGRVNIGNGDGAANGASESDLSGTGMANGIGVADVGGGINYRQTGTGTTPAPFGPSVGATINQQDFESRYDRLMYVTPSFNGFRGQVSVGQKSGNVAVGSVGGTLDVTEVGVFYGGKMGGLGDLIAAVGFSSKDGSQTTEKDEYMGGSVSWLHTSGFNLTFSYTKRDQPVALGAASRDSKFTYIKAGYKWGQHAIGVDYAMGDDFSAVGDEAKMYGVGYVWNPIRWLELYAAYKIHQLDRSGAEFDDVTIAHVGTRIRF